MRYQGHLVDWNEARGFGFVQPHGGGDRCFVHASAFHDRHRRPASGDVITYKVHRDSKGRSNAASVHFSLEAKRRRTRSKSSSGKDHFPRRSVAALFVGAFATASILLRWPAWMPLVYLITSTLTYFVYWHDKSAAQHDRRRTPESTLQLLALIGGWPGALIAQSILRHKTRKRSFQVIFCVMVGTNLLGMAWFLASMLAQDTPR